MSADQVAESNSHHERRFAQIDRDIFSVKTDVGVLQADVKTLAAGQLALQSSQDRGFTDIKETLQAKSQEQPKISVAMLISILGVMMTILVVGVGAFWSVVLLLADPIRSELREHKLSTLTHAKELALLDERGRQLQASLDIRLAATDEHSIQRHAVQAAEIARLEESTGALKQLALEAARQDGRLNALEEVRRLNEERVCERLRVIESRSTEPPTP